MCLTGILETVVSPQVALRLCKDFGLQVFEVEVGKLIVGQFLGMLVQEGELTLLIASAESSEMDKEGHMTITLRHLLRTY